MTIGRDGGGVRTLSGGLSARVRKVSADSETVARGHPKYRQIKAL